jgi:hypothetical protein
LAQGQAERLQDLAQSAREHLGHPQNPVEDIVLMHWLIRSAIRVRRLHEPMIFLDNE